MTSSLISVITVVRNAQPTLEATIQSVISLDKNIVEYWIIDGGSTDGTIDIIKKYEHQLAGWCSEPDKGIYDAMNKAVKFAKGEWLYFLGADDKLMPNVLASLIPVLSPVYTVVFGDVCFDSGFRMKSFLGPRTILQNTLHHQSAFYHKSNFNSFRYDSKLRIAADYELNLKIYLEKSPVLHVSSIIATCATGGVSSRWSDSLNEINTIRARYIKGPLISTLLSLILKLYYVQKRVRSWLYGHRV